MEADARLRITIVCQKETLIALGTQAEAERQAGRPSIGFSMEVCNGRERLRRLKDALETGLVRRFTVVPEYQSER